MSLLQALGDRMKEFYESVPDTRLSRRTPVIIRFDGKNFSSYTRGLIKPYDSILTEAMQETAKELCSKIQGAVLAYTQSDEITIVLQDYATVTTDAWFGYRVQKMCSIGASLATVTFNKIFSRLATERIRALTNGELSFDGKMDVNTYINTLNKRIDQLACFDARVFNIPAEEVTNCLLWRQLDATRNSIEAVSRAYFSHKELENVSCNQMQEMLMAQKCVNWNNTPTHLKRGSCVIKADVLVEADSSNPDSKQTVRKKWVIDKEIPEFSTPTGREYIESIMRGIRLD